MRSRILPAVGVSALALVAASAFAPSAVASKHSTPTATHQSSSKAHQTSVAKKYKKGCRVDQSDGDVGNAVSSQNFESDFDAYDDMAADDFMCNSKKKKVKVTNLYAYGDITADQPGSFNVSIHEWDNSTPVGKVVCDSPGSNYTLSQGPPSEFQYNITLNSSCTLRKGVMYWLVVQANLDFLPNGSQWYWNLRQPINNDEGAWSNPGGGFGSCTDYGSIGDCVVGDGGDYDTVFQI